MDPAPTPCSPAENYLAQPIPKGCLPQWSVMPFATRMCYTIACSWLTRGSQQLLFPPDSPPPTLAVPTAHSRGWAVPSRKEVLNNSFIEENVHLQARPAAPWLGCLLGGAMGFLCSINFPLCHLWTGLRCPALHPFPGCCGKH